MKTKKNQVFSFLVVVVLFFLYNASLLRACFLFLFYVFLDFLMLLLVSGGFIIRLHCAASNEKRCVCMSLASMVASSSATTPDQCGMVSQHDFVEKHACLDV